MFQDFPIAIPENISETGWHMVSHLAPVALRPKLSLGLPLSLFSIYLIGIKW